MNPRSPTEFQNGIIDIFKTHRIYDLNIVDCAKKGDVLCEMDKEIGRKVIKISGNLSPGNNIAIPNTKYTRGLYYYGKYFYVFFKAYNDKKFYFQFTFIFNNSNTIRFIFKFPLKQLKISRTNAYNIEIPVEMDETRSGLWSLYKFDPVEFINKNLIQYKDFSSLAGITTENTILKSFEAFASLSIRGVYISNYSFNINALPKEMNIRTVNNRNVVDIYYYDICNGEIGNVEEAHVDEEEKVEIPKTKVKKYETEDFSDSLAEIKRKQQQLKIEEMKRKKENIVSETMKKLEKATQPKINEDEIRNRVQNNADLKEVNHELLKKNMENINQDFIDERKEAIKNLFRKEGHRKTPLLPDPMINLNYILGYTAQKCSKVQFNSSGDFEATPSLYKEEVSNPTRKHIFFTSGTTLIKYDPFSIKQTFYFGHSKPISNFILACHGEILFSNQEGTNSIIRIWKTETGRCIKMLTTPFDKIIMMTENKESKYLCTVGNEQNKGSIIIWDISNLDDISVSIRQSSPIPINTMKFSPFENNILVSCGRENIKFWRIKKDHLTGKAVVLNQYARNNNFLCIGFNSTMFGDESSTDKGKVYVGSSNGCVFQIACNNQELEAVYKVQDAAILSICVNEAFCVTGSLDGYLRVWPVDFSEFLIEAKHDSGVCSVDISYDALDILCGTLNGSIGLLNVQSKQYKTVLRSPPGLIHSMIAHPSGDFLFTLEGDNCVRVWDVEKKSEAFQFVSTKDPPNCLAAPKMLVFACGFQSGIIKIFDLEKTEILYECKPFQSEVKNLMYIQNDKFLIAMSAQGNMSIHDASDNHIQVKLLKIDIPAIYTDLSLSVDKEYFASIGPDSNCALVWNSNTFGMKNRVPVSNFFIKKLCLISKNLLGCILENCCVRFYALSTYEGIFIKELMNIHIHQINQFIVSKNYKFLISSGEEGMIKIWDMKMVFKPFQSYQQFIGHASGVRAIILMENKSLLISASENSGIYFWNYLGDVTFTETEISQEMEKLTDVNLMKDISKKLSNTKITATGASFYNPNKTIKQQPKINESNLTSNIRMKHMEKIYNLENPTNPNYEIVTKGNEEIKDEKIKGNELIMLPVQEDKEGVNCSFSNNDFTLTQEQYKKFETENEDEEDEVVHQEIIDKLLYSIKYLPEKIENYTEPNITSNKLKLKLCLGLSINSMHNLILNKNDKWYAYTINNKIVVEFFEEKERKQLVLIDSKDELSCLAISPNGKFLVAGVGCVNRDEYAAILVYETNNFTLKKKLNFHFKGIQTIKISPNGKYMISIGSKEEKSICIWNFANLTVIDSKSIKFSPIDMICEDTKDMFLYFISAASDVLSFWRMDSNLKMEGFHINFEDLTNERAVGEFITGLTLSPYYDQIKTSFVIVGSNKGNILIFDKEKKVLVRKYIISKFPITKIYFVGSHFICAGEGPIIYHWEFDPKKISISNVFSFLENQKSNLLFLDSSVTSVEISENGNEGLLITDIGSIFFINFEKKSAFKIISSHINCKIPFIECDLSDSECITCGKDSTIRSWTMDSFDQKFQLLKLGQNPDAAKLNPKENILISHYDSSYLRLFNISTLKSLGIIKIPNEDICKFDLLFNYQGILLTTHQEKIYVIDVQNWEPLSVLYTELSEKPSSIPKNQYCKSLQCKSLSAEKAYAVTSYSDGTVITFSVEKINNRIEIQTIDKFNMIEMHMLKTDDNNVKEMYGNLSKFKSDYMTKAQFSNHFDGILLSFHECLQFLWIRNYQKNEVMKCIPLNYFPFSLNISDDEHFIAIGSKEGLILFVTRTDESYVSGFNLDIFKGHYDSVDYLKFSHNNRFLFSSSYSEVFVWEIKA